MKRMMQWMIAAILVCGVGVFTSCTSNYDNPTQVRLQVIGLLVVVAASRMHQHLVL